MFGFPKVVKEAPLVLTLELWPAKLKARATLVKEGKSRDVEISAPVVAFVLQFLKPYLK